MNTDNITLLAVVGQPRYLEKTLKALLVSREKFPCKNVKLLTCSTDNIPEDILVKEIDALSYNEYNKFILKSLTDYVDTDFVITIQDDGFIINPDKWSSEFLNYDYIGAPWPKHWPTCETYNVGNGGFSLRSKKFLELTKEVCPYIEGENEDVLCCRTYRHLLEPFGIKYASPEVAVKFSIEHTNGIPELNNGQVADRLETLDSFGFHYIKSNIIDKF